MSIANDRSGAGRQNVRLQRAKELLSAIGGSVSSSSVGGGRDGEGIRKRVLSAEARRKIAEAQRKRWAAQKKVAK